MKIQIFSDLHLEFHTFEPARTDADIIVLAGDIHIGVQGIQWAIQTFPDRPVLYILGNHEYYHQSFPELKDQILEKTQNTNIFLLENNDWIFEQVRFLGCTLWTDFSLYNEAEKAREEAESYMNDYNLIRYGQTNRCLTSAHTIENHLTSKAWLEKKLAEAFLGDTIVITHHGPSERSIAEKWKDNTLNAAFASSLDNLIIDNNIKLWIHGHTHSHMDYILGNTRVICNPRGYPKENYCQFDTKLVIEI